MPSEQHRKIALDGVRASFEQFQSILVVTIKQIQGLLAGSESTNDDQAVALGMFAKNKVNIERFAAFTSKPAALDNEAEGPIRATEQVLKFLLNEGEKLYIINVETGQELDRQLNLRLASIGRAFAAARVIDLVKSGAYKEQTHASMLESFPYSKWNQSERSLVPALVIEVDGADFKPAAIVPLLDGNTKIIFNVTGDAPAAAMSRLISPGVFVQQETADAELKAFTAFKGTAVAAFLPTSAVSFIHQPTAGSTTYERFTSLTFPKDVKKRAIGGISPTQQAEDYGLLQSLSEPPESAIKTANSDHAGKLSAWLLDKTNLADIST